MTRLTEATSGRERRPDFWRNEVNSAGENRPWHRTFLTSSRMWSRFLVAKMLLARSKRELIPAGAIVVALLVLEIGLGSRVEASCGAYLHKTVVSSDVGQGLVGNENGTDTTHVKYGMSTIVPVATEPLPMNGPCSGPGCSRGSRPPFVPAVPVNTQTHRIDVCDVNSVVATGHSFSGRRTSTTVSAHALRGFPPMIEVPPEGGC